MATAIALSFKCPKDKILKAVKNFRGNEHRLEFVHAIRGFTRINADKNYKNTNVNQSNRNWPAFVIKFYNDSASTNPQTAAAAISAFKEPKTKALRMLSALVLIAGGKDK